MATPSKTIAVIGTGVIGSSWTALFLTKGHKVIVTDPAPDAERKLHEYLQKTCPTVPRSTLTAVNCLENVTFVADIDPYLPSVDLIQENGPERLDIKRPLIARLDALTPPHIPILSSSSGLPSSTFITECTNNPGRILIGHPFNPPHLVPLVEVVPHPGTSDEYVDAAYAFYKSLDKDPIIVRQETPGFIANRLQAALCAEAYSLIGRGVVSAQDLDKTMTSGLGLRWALTGPIMTNTLGGGGDFGHFMDHLGPALKGWVYDMEAQGFDFEDKDSVDAVKQRVNGWVGGVDLAGVERRRDEGLVGLVQRKQNGSRRE
ncbi:uncharacterized protein DSM5745_05985 [Aspergillus mulundensis]|uniref:3-hydroxyacyl-CoA dehydrogenase n=1 Tax=Aspergillus mulundensis TaxID=1810919 RepID=A0A3D8RYJ3_9EURO|nr:Uncharacterized protein DSM5745_05985 [Aspergillus mulundensis]RDW79133.1 Uncharacterized protein DSM5745_05985 [Aspergillus mulundensis]